ncbi:MAG: TonB-dependent receptor [Ignavibacteriae bacterium]|nr:MAG: TonB-dependent receptor [Ignavibacteriota bacterium]
MRTYIKLLFLLFLFLSSSTVVYSQEDTSGFQTEEIMVTGTRLEQKIIDIPFSVQRVDQSKWISSRKQGLNDVLTTVPGLFLQSRYGNHDVRVTIRGFGSRSNSGIRGVRILLDGIPESEPDGQTRIEAIDFSSIGKIEIVKGNSSSLYTNAPGGVINFLTDKYFPLSFVQSSNEFGSYDLRKNDIKVGINAGKTRFMLIGGYENYKGYRQHSEEYQTRINTIYEVDLNARSKMSIFGYYVNGLIKLPGSLTLTKYLENDTAANSRDVGRDAKRITYKGRIGISYNASFDIKNSENRIEVTGYGTIKDFNRTAKTYRIFDRSGIGGSFRYINKIKFGKRTNEFSLGGDLYYQTGPIAEYNNNGGEKGDFMNITDETISNVGFYVIDQITVIPNKLTFLATGRFDKVNFEALDLSTRLYKDTTRIFTGFTPKFALNYKLNRSLALYASFGLSFDSPAFNELDNNASTNNPNVTINPDLEPQKSTNIEAGIKGYLPMFSKDFLKYTFIEVTYFNCKIKDAIIPFSVESDVFFRNAGTVKRQGVEAGINSEIVKGLNLSAAYTYSDFKYDEYIARTVDENGVITDIGYDGNLEPSIPKHLISADLTYKYNFSNNYGVFVKGNIQHVGEMFVEDANYDSLMTKSYTLLNGQIGIDFNIAKNLKLFAYGGVNNIADKKYVAFININSNNSEYYESGPRRNFFGGLTLGYMFK